MDEWSKLLVFNEKVMTKSAIYVYQRHVIKVYKYSSVIVFLQTGHPKETDSVRVHSFIYLFHIPLILSRCETSHVYI